MRARGRVCGEERATRRVLGRLVARTAGRVGSGIDQAFVYAAFRSGRAGRRAVRASGAERLTMAAEFYADAERSGRLYRTPEPARIAEASVGRLRGGAVVDVRWRSEYAPLHEGHRETCARCPGNAWAHARWYRHDVVSPVLLCLHGWGGGYFPVEALAFRARRLYAQGFDVVLVNLPFHARRAPPGRVRPMFPSTDPVRANEGFAQAVMDVRALVATLLARGAPAVGVTGMSLGGYTSALLATVEARLAFVVPIIPFSSLPRLMWEHGEGTAARARAEAVGITLDHFAPAFAATDPLARAPVVDPPRILIIAGERDRVTPSHHARRLHEHFAGSRFLTFPGSHLVHAGLDEVFAEVVAFAQGIGQ